MSWNAIYQLTDGIRMVKNSHGRIPSPPSTVGTPKMSMCSPSLGETLSQKSQNSNQNNNNKITFAKHSDQLLNKIAKVYLLNNFTFTSLSERGSVFLAWVSHVTSDLVTGTSTQNTGMPKSL